MTSVSAPQVAATANPVGLRSGLLSAAAKDVAAVTPGLASFGLTLGITATRDGADPGAVILGAAAIFGGSAQLTSLTLLHLGAGLLAAVLSGAVVNARIILYGAALEPRFRGQPLWFRLIAPHYIQDQAYLAALGRAGLMSGEFRRYWAWLGSLLLLVWTGSVTAGVLLAPALPPLPHLALVGTALFIGMLVPKLVNRTSVVSVVVAAAVALVVGRFAPELAILAGTVAGVAAAMAVDGGDAS